jgi:hypothetical protein
MSREPPRAQFMWRHELLSASTPALAWTLVGNPFKVITVRLQTSSPTQYTGAWSCLRTTVAQEGVLTLWKGFVPIYLASVPYSIGLFGTFSYLRPPRPTAQLSTDSLMMTRHLLGVFGAGFVSGTVLTVLHNPFDVWRTRIQASTSSSPGVLKTLWSQPKLVPHSKTRSFVSPVYFTALVTFTSRF